MRASRSASPITKASPIVQRDAHGRTLALHASDPREVEGGEIALTLDSAMQAAAESALADVVAERGARGGIVLTLDPKNGDVLALAEAPGFDPNRFRELKYADTRARTFSDVVEAGSTMKVFLAASALDNGDIDEAMLFDTGDGSIRVPGKTIKDRDPFGIVTPSDVLRVSSNVGAVQIAQRMGAEAQHRGLERFGFGKLTGSGFPTEERGLLRSWKHWRPVDQATIAFGQGVSVTPIQLGVALAALANDGMRMRPRIVLARRRDGGRWAPTEVREAGRAISPIAARKTLDMMQTVVSPTGTGRLAGLAGVAVAGKTGTAQKLDSVTHRYSQSKYIAWFIGAVPADDPELVIVVAIDEPKGYLHTGGMVAAPLFARVAAAQLARRNILTEPAPIAPPPKPTLVVQNDGPAAAGMSSASIPATGAAPIGAKPAAQAPPAQAAPAPAAWPVSTGTEPVATPDVAAGPAPSHDDLPRKAAKAAPPARPAASPAAGHSPSTVVARASAPDDADPVFVPDFLGQTLAVARRLAERESLTISTNGAADGRVVSQVPVAGTVLHGANRTIRLRLATTRKEG
ncbi:MAG: PASTA domain-containing protein [Deltaproteobacteria bacterium]|nr:PASTA domain-containing protein [Deltaproteobacteria bacterium]